MLPFLMEPTLGSVSFHLQMSPNDSVVCLNKFEINVIDVVISSSVTIQNVAMGVVIKRSGRKHEVLVSY